MGGAVWRSVAEGEGTGERKMSLWPWHMGGTAEQQNNKQHMQRITITKYKKRSPLNRPCSMSSSETVTLGTPPLAPPLQALKGLLPADWVWNSSQAKV